jgi:hypothetical protein
MIGTSMIESEPPINKVLWLHKNWRVMLAGDDIAPASPIMETAKQSLSRIKAPTLTQVRAAMYESYCGERTSQSEALYLSPRGWTLKDFNSVKASILPESLREEIGTKISSIKVEVSLLVAGFDNKGKGHIFSVDDYEDRGKPRSQDLPGYHAIGSGANAASYMMAFREVSAKLPLRLVLYYAVEAKYFGEKAGGVGTRTDVLIMRSGLRPFRVSERTLEDALFKLCYQLEPRFVRKQHVEVLNKLKGPTLSTVPRLDINKQNGDWVISVLRPSTSRKSAGR